MSTFVLIYFGSILFFNMMRPYKNLNIISNTLMVTTPIENFLISDQIFKSYNILLKVIIC